jgi:hypothetical protein
MEVLRVGQKVGQTGVLPKVLAEVHSASMVEE